jgi:hypothetical protein
VPIMDIVLGAFIGIGVVVALQGILAIRGKRRVRPNFFERHLLEVVVPKDQAQMSRLLGRIRLAYGFFLIVLGFWAIRS